MEVQFTHLAKKQLAKTPQSIQDRLQLWALQIKEKGYGATLILPTWRDEALKGQRYGQRSIRLNRQYRAIYTLEKDVLLITVLEVTPHDYRTR
jgi:proteic killer suppression protein